MDTNKKPNTKPRKPYAQLLFTRLLRASDIPFEQYQGAVTTKFPLSGLQFSFRRPQYTRIQRIPLNGISIELYTQNLIHLCDKLYNNGIIENVDYQRMRGEAVAITARQIRL